jgi:hypothetical protein
MFMYTKQSAVDGGGWMNSAAVNTIRPLDDQGDFFCLKVPS